MNDRSPVADYGGTVAIFAIAVSAAAAVHGAGNRLIVLLCGVGAGVLLARGRQTDGESRVAYLSTCAVLIVIATVVFVVAEAPENGPASAPTVSPTPSPSSVSPTTVWTSQPPATVRTSQPVTSRPSTPRPPVVLETPLRRTVRAHSVTTFYGGALKVTVGTVSSYSAEITLATARGTCDTYVKLGDGVVIQERRTDKWYDVLVVGLDEFEHATIEVQRGADDDAPRRGGYCPIQ